MVCGTMAGVADLPVTFESNHPILISKLRRSLTTLKGIGKEFQQSVIRRYLDKSTQKKHFCHLQSLQITTIFQEIKLKLRNLLSRYM